VNGGEEIPLGLFVACSDGAELIELGEEVLDQVAHFVDLCIELAGRLAPKRGRKRLFNAAIHSLRLCVERTFSWEDKFKRLLLRFEIKNPRSKLRGIGGRKEADQKNAASCGEYVPKEIQTAAALRYETDGLHIDQSEAFLWCLRLATSYAAETFQPTPAAIAF
jgi:hypothetical protein